VKVPLNLVQRRVATKAGKGLFGMGTGSSDEALRLIREAEAEYDAGAGSGPVIGVRPGAAILSGDDYSTWSSAKVAALTEGSQDWRNYWGYADPRRIRLYELDRQIAEEKKAQAVDAAIPTQKFFTASNIVDDPNKPSKFPWMTAAAATGGAAALATTGLLLSNRGGSKKRRGPARRVPILPIQPRRDNTLLYAGLGAVALVGAFLLFSK